MTPLFPSTHLDAADVLRAGRSSFAPAFRLLPTDRRRDLTLLYAFCRVADDIADAPGPSRAERHQALGAWEEGFRDPEMRGLPKNLRELILRRALDRRYFLELLKGIASDIDPTVRMATRADLDLYCHRVAGTVGHLCLPIFGADPQRTADYAEKLGRALQYTNILRDTASDLQRGRIYYPLEELAAAGLDADSFPTGARHFLQSFARETETLFAAAAAAAPSGDARALRPARIMAAVYRALLTKMQRDGLRVLEKRYRLSSPEKLLAIARGMFAQ